jgi:pyrimidine operon attenuation protein / uracil phosphoribosyltransferase
LLFFIHSLFIFAIVKVILNQQQLQLTISRLAHQLIENGEALDQTVFLGLQPRGVRVSDRIIAELQRLCPNEVIQYGKLDITFYRDDVREELHVAKPTDIPFSIEGKDVVLIDDVLYTGRTIRAALDAIQDFGRPRKVTLCVLVNRHFNRELPIQPDFCGKALDTIISQKVKVEWDQEEVVLY